MSDDTPTTPEPRKYQTGDVINGYVLMPDGSWQPAPTAIVSTPPQPSGMSTGAKVAVAAIVAVGAILGLGIIGAIVSDDAAPTADPAPTATVTEAAPTPVDPPTPTTTPIEQTPDYVQVQLLLDRALAKTDADMDAVCIAWTVQKAKYTDKFANTAVRTLGADYDTSWTAVDDWFNDQCGT